MKRCTKTIKTENIAQLYKHGFIPKEVMKTLPKEAIGFTLYGENESFIGSFRVINDLPKRKGKK